MNPEARRALLRDYAATHGARRAANFDWAMRSQIFAGIDFNGKALLDVGCGRGSIALWAAAHGARRVVGLEPEVKGSSAGMRGAFERSAAACGLQDKVELVPEPLQTYDRGSERFDVVVLTASINHLDEQACMRLHEDEQARATYRSYLHLLANAAAPGAHLIVTDCDRHNVFQRLDIRNPLAPTIEWEKHQHPKLWASLLGDVGFERPNIRWTSLNTLRAPGQLLLGNRACSYLMASTFVLRMRRALGVGG